MDSTHVLCPKCSGYGRLYYQDDTVAGCHITSEICPVCGGDGKAHGKCELSASDKRPRSIDHGVLIGKESDT